MSFLGDELIFEAIGKKLPCIPFHGVVTVRAAGDVSWSQSLEAS